MFGELSDIYNEVILDHEKSPRNFHVMEGANRKAQGYNPVCGDNITLYLNLENDVIKDVSFSGSGCALCKASASLLTEYVKNKSKTEAEEMFRKVRELMLTGSSEGDLGKLVVFSSVHKRPIRIKCAILSWHALAAALKGEEQPVTTESEQN
jgi:nitrogen fixation NifU-like protein